MPTDQKPPLKRSDAVRNLPGSTVLESTFAPLLRTAHSNGMFSRLSESDAKIVFSFCHFGFVDHDVCLFKAGDQAEYMLFVVDGRVNVSCNRSDNQVMQVGTAGIGAILGESAVTSISQRTASAITASRCALGYLYYEDFHRLCLAHPKIALDFLIMMFDQMSGRMRAMVKQLTEASEVRLAAETSLGLLSKVLFDRRIGAPRPTGDGAPQVERRSKNLSSSG